MLYFKVGNSLSRVQSKVETQMKKRCYYEILEIDRKAQVSDIKQSYRKLALKYHPDKSTEDDAKQMFIEIQQAYQVLSDPNERTWYDNNREKILFDKDSMSKEDLQMHTFGFNIWQFFSSACYKGYQEQSETNFYKVYRQVFQKIKESQKKAFEYDNDGEGDLRKLQGFGMGDTNIEKVLRFYEDWDNITTYKSFVWKEEWDTKQAPNRWVRRQMEKQNKKEIQKEKKFYIKTIKDLISYLKKRDPRYQNYLLEVQELQAKKEQEKKVRVEEEKKFKEQQKQVKKQLQEQRMRQVQEYYRNQEQDGQQKHIGEDRDCQEEFYCEICQKDFKTENQLSNHNNSKLHKQNVKLLMNEVVLDSDKKEKGKEIAKSLEPPPPKKSKVEPKGNKQSTKPVQVKIQEPERAQRKKKNRKKKEYQLSSEEDQPQQQPVPVKDTKPVQEPKVQSESSSEDDFVSSMLKNRNQKAKLEANLSQQKPAKAKKPKPKEESQESSQQSQQVQKQLGMAKQRRLKKQQRQQEEKEKFKCLGCKEMFPSKTKLFGHIKDSGHAAPKK